MQFALSFLTLFIHSEVGVEDLSEAALWVGISQLLSASCFATMSPARGLLSDRVGGKKMLVRVLIAKIAVPGFPFSFHKTVPCFHYPLDAGSHGWSEHSGHGDTFASSVEEDRLVEAIEYQQSAQMIGFLLGPAIGAMMTTIFGFRLCFI